MVTARLHRWAPAAVGAALLLFALGNALRAMPGSDWPFIFDSCRDLGTAQVILEGRYPQDNIYPEMSLWFNPFTGALIALASRLTGVEPALASAQMGPWINLLPAIAFFLLARWWAGAWAAVGALAAYLFFNAQSQPGPYATYTPWLFAGHLAIGWFCVSLLAFARARETGLLKFYLLAGLFHGLAFTTHTASAVLLGCIVCGVTLVDVLVEGGRVRARLVGLALLLGAAFLISLPYGWVLIAHHQLHILNPFPAYNTENPMQLSALRAHLLSGVHLGNALALIGFLYLLMRPRLRGQRMLLLVWLGLILFWLSQGYLHQAGYPALTLVPAHHFHAAFTLLRALCFGAAVAGLGAWLWQSPVLRQPAWLRPAVVAVVLALVFAPAVWRYVAWEEFRFNARERAPYAAQWDARAKVAAWFRDNASPDDITLCDDMLAVLAVGSVGRGAVGTMLIFSSPYVDAGRRLTDRDMMFECLRAKDPKGFVSLARQYKVKHILASGSEDELVRAANFPFVTLVLESTPLRLYRVSLP